VNNNKTTTFKPQNLLNFFREAEKLKTVLRHSYLSTGRQESVAEHAWMMLLLAMTLMSKIERPLNQAKVLRMIVIHDLAEAVTRDVPVWEGVKDRAKKIEHERSAMEKMLASLDSQTQHEFMTLWEEYETRESFEARFVKALDTLDVVAQHYTAAISTWDDNDYLWQLSPMQDSFFDLDPLLRQIKDELDAWSIEKVQTEGKLEKLDQLELQKRQKSMKK
jgi:putative hydrolase of HD superfamily